MRKLVVIAGCMVQEGHALSMRCFRKLSTEEIKGNVGYALFVLERFTPELPGEKP